MSAATPRAPASSWSRTLVLAKAFSRGVPTYIQLARRQRLMLLDCHATRVCSRISTSRRRLEAGALPEMLEIAYGSLVTGLDLRAGQSLLIRGGTSSVGLA